MEDGLATKPGLQELTSVKLNFLEKIMDGSVTRVCGMSTKLEHLEIPGCEQISDYCIE